MKREKAPAGSRRVTRVVLGGAILLGSLTAGYELLTLPEPESVGIGLTEIAGYIGTVAGLGAGTYLSWTGLERPGPDYNYDDSPDVMADPLGGTDAPTNVNLDYEGGE